VTKENFLTIECGLDFDFQCKAAKAPTYIHSLLQKLLKYPGPGNLWLGTYRASDTPVQSDNNSSLAKKVRYSVGNNKRDHDAEVGSTSSGHRHYELVATRYIPSDRPTSAVR
jgi:hypothetical protein